MFSRPPLGSTAIFGIPWYSLLIVSAVILGILLAQREEKRLKLPKDTILDFALWAIPLAIVGARIYYVIFRWDLFQDQPLRIFAIWEGGIAIYGGILGGLLAAWLLSRRRKISMLTLLDACAPSLVLGQAIGRWGNYANMEAYGARITNPAFQFFPLAVEIPVGSHWYWHMATFFYESAWCAIVFLLLMRIRKRVYRRGDVVAWYALLYSAGRAVIEGLRTDSLTFLNEFVRVSQVLSAVICLAVLLLFFVHLRQNRKIHLLDTLCWCIAIPALVCAFLGEFERGAYQSLFFYSQLFCGLLLLLDLGFFCFYYQRARRFHAPAITSLAMATGMLLLLLLGIGRADAVNVAFVSLRQSVCMLHLIGCGAWFYLRAGAPRKAISLRPQTDGFHIKGQAKTLEEE